MGSDVRRRAVQVVLDLAGRQHGVVLARQLREAGLSERIVRTMVGDGWLCRIRPGAFIVGSPAPTPWQSLVATWMILGPDAVVSHATAARIQRLPGVAPENTLELSLPSPRHARPSGAVVHRVSSLAAGDIRDYRGLPITTPARTLIDLAPRLPGDVLGHVIDEALVNRMLTLEDLEGALARAVGRTGVGDLRALVETRSDTSRADSLLEVRAQRVLRPLRPFEFHYEVIMDGRLFILDFAWPALKVAAECDGWGTRGRSRTKFDHDRRRNNLLVAAGWRIAQLTSAMSDDEILNSVLRLMMVPAAGA